MNTNILEKPTIPTMQTSPTVALLGWGELFEDFHDTIGVSIEKFCEELTGGWLFNYIDALQLVGVRTVLFFPSDRVSAVSRFTHKATGATVCVLPAPKIHRAFRHFSSHFPFLLGIKSSLGAYLATPLGSLARELKREGCSAILCQEYEYPRFDACVLLGKLIGLPVFATFQGGDKPLSRFEIPIRPLTLRAANGIIIASQTETDRVQARYSCLNGKIARIFNPMDATNWIAFDRNEARVAIDIPLDAQVVVCHGRIEIERKGLDILLEAWDQVHSARPGRNLQLLLVGTGTDSNALQQQIIARNLQGVKWINEYVRDRTKILQYLSAADVYTLPSRHEGFPVAPLEAMACGLPVVAAAAPGVPDILENNELSGGIVVPRDNAAALAEALGRVLDDDALRAELGKRARERVEQHFSLDAIGKQLRDFLLNTQQGDTNDSI